MSQSGKPPQPRVIIIGLDSLTFDLIDPWLEEGFLPNLARVAKRGARGVLTSCFLPLSPPAWTTITTGKNPGGHGIFGFAVLEPGSYHVDTIDARWIHIPRLWDFINQQGLSTGVFNVPVTYPIQPVNGYMIGGFLTPDTNRTFTHPKELADEVFKIDGGYRILPTQLLSSVTPQPYIDELEELINTRLKIVEHLIAEHPTDFGMFVFMEADWVQHKMWQVLQQSRENNQYYEAVRKLYRRLDDAVGRIMELAGPDCNYVIVSDHGAGYHDRVMHINKWLYDNKFLFLKKSFEQRIKSLIERARVIQMAYWVVSRIQARFSFVKKFFPTAMAGKAVDFFASYDIDWERTRAYGCDAIGQIYVNLKGRQPQGTVSEGPEYDALLTELETLLRELKDPRTGRPIVTEMRRAREVYPGPYAKDGPDLLLILDEFRCTAAVRFGFDTEGYFSGVEFHDYGSHRPNGIIMACGPDIAAGTELQGATIADITPTILRLMDLPIPADLHGRSLEEMLSPAFRQSHPPKIGGAGGPGTDVTAADDAASSEQMKDKLKALGYL